jgi:hypothetical protein
MNTKGFIRSAAASIATAGILGGGASRRAQGRCPDRPPDGGAAAAAGAAEVADGPGRPQP